MKVQVISPARLIKFHINKAIREGRLHRYCSGTYGDKYVKEHFCPACEFASICASERKEKK